LSFQASLPSHERIDRQVAVKQAENCFLLISGALNETVSPTLDTPVK